MLTQVILILMEYINLEPRFHSREEVALSLAEYLAGLSSWRTRIPHSTLLYYYRRLSSVRYVVPLSGFYAVDETKVLVVGGNYYYVWIVRKSLEKKFGDTKKIKVKDYLLTLQRAAVV